MFQAGSSVRNRCSLNPDGVIEGFRRQGVWKRGPRPPSPNSQNCPASSARRGQTRYAAGTWTVWSGSLPRALPACTAVEVQWGRELLKSTKGGSRSTATHCPAARPSWQAQLKATALRWSKEQSGHIQTL
jgi:hypothetical protein